MKDLLLWIIVLLGCAGLLLYAGSKVEDARSERMRAEATLIRAQSQARLDATSAYLPYVVITVAVVGGLVALCITGFVLVKLGAVDQRPARIIETRTIILLQPGQSRRELWQLLSEAETVKALPPKSNKSNRKEPYA